MATTVFAIGDLTAIAEAKTARAAGEPAEVVARNIRSLIQSGAELVAYRPAPPAISLLPDFRSTLLGLDRAEQSV